MARELLWDRLGPATGRGAAGETTETAFPEVAVHSAVASGEPLEASVGEPLVGRQGPGQRTLDAGYALRQGVQVAAVR